MLRRLIAAVALVVAAVLPIASPVSADFTPKLLGPPTSIAVSVPDPSTCAGYPEPRVGVEIQGWWQDRVGEAFPGRHVHAYVCYPTGAVSGIVGLDIKIQTHKQPVGNRVTRLRATDGGGSDVFPAMTTGFTALDANGDMVQWVHKDINTDSLSAGLHEIRLAVYVRQTHAPDGTDIADFDQLVSSDLPLFVRSMSGGATSRDYVEARGWYPGFLYTNARYLRRLSDFLNPVPDLWTPTVQCASPSGENADQMDVNVDPGFHTLNYGIPVFSYPGETTKTLSIDTTGLAAGTHKIVTRCAATANLSGHDGTSTGVLAINFTR